MSRGQGTHSNSFLVRWQHCHTWNPKQLRFNSLGQCNKVTGFGFALGTSCCRGRHPHKAAPGGKRKKPIKNVLFGSVLLMVSAAGACSQLSGRIQVPLRRHRLCRAVPSPRASATPAGPAPHRRGRQRRNQSCEATGADTSTSRGHRMRPTSRRENICVAGFKVRTRLRSRCAHEQEFL